MVLLDKLIMWDFFLISAEKFSVRCSASCVSLKDTEAEWIDSICSGVNLSHVVEG